MWRSYKTEVVENQTKALLPYNEVSKTLFYNTRTIISADLPIPITWRVTKVEGLAHKGNIMFTFAQDLFDEHHDYIERDDNGKLLGMWANYYLESNLPSYEPIEPNPKDFGSNYAEITFAGTDPHIKIGGSYKKITLTYYNSNEELLDQTPGEWSYFIDDTDATELVRVLTTDNPNVIKVKFLGDDEYIGKTLVIKNTRYDNIVAELQLQIVAL